MAGKQGRVARTTFGAAIALAGTLLVRELVRQRPGEPATLIDWDLVRRRACAGTGERGPTHVAISAGRLGREYDEALQEMVPWIQDALEEQLHDAPFPHFQVLDRTGWVDVNLRLFQGLMEPVLKLQSMVPATVLTDLGRRGISEYMGRLLGFLSQRVLGQYDPVLMAPGVAGPTALYLVEPNIEAWEARTPGLPAEQTRQWLVLHEATHAWEFEAHPWLRDHLNGLMRELLAQRLFAQEKPGRLEMIRALTVGARSQWKAMSQVQATMSLLEGFSNVMMRLVGEAHLPNFKAVDAEFNRRSRQRGPAERAFLKITGIDMKMQQYVMGERFCNEVMAGGGMAALRRAWQGPESLPTLEEIKRPALWVERVATRPALALIGG